MYITGSVNVARRLEANVKIITNTIDLIAFFSVKRK